MMTTDTRRAESDLRHDTARLLMAMADAVQSGAVRRWQIETVLPSLRMVAHVMGITAAADSAGR
jgi:hypothetical protein